MLDRDAGAGRKGVQEPAKHLRGSLPGSAKQEGLPGANSSIEIVVSNARNPTMSRLMGWALLVLAGVAWGLTFSLAKIAADGGGHPLGINYWQSLVGTVFLTSMIVITGQKFKLKRGDIMFYAACSMLGMVIPGTIFYYAASRISPGVLSITVATVPLITVVGAALIGIEKLKLGRVIGVMLGVVSIILLVGPDESLPDRSAIGWVLAVVFSAICYSAEGLLVALRKPVGVSAMTVAAGMYIAGSIILTPLVIATGAFVPIGWHWGSAEWAIIGLALLSVTAYSIFIYLIVRTGPVFSSQTAYIVTFSGVIWGIAIFGETHSIWIWASLVVMLAALVLVTPANTTKED